MQSSNSFLGTYLKEITMCVCKDLPIRMFMAKLLRKNVKGYQDNQDILGNSLTKPWYIQTMEDCAVIRNVVLEKYFKR